MNPEDDKQDVQVPEYLQVVPVDVLMAALMQRCSSGVFMGGMDRGEGMVFVHCMRGNPFTCVGFAKFIGEYAQVAGTRGARDMRDFQGGEW